MKTRTSWPRAIAAAALALGLAFSGAARAQLFGVNPFDNDNAAPPGSFGLFYLNPATGAITGGRVITMAGFTVVGAQALARDPTTGVVYAALTVTGSPTRMLATLNLASGVATLVGNLGDRFATLAFRADGQLFGVTGDGGLVPETLYLIDKATAATVIATALGNGDDGEVIAYNPSDNSFYHWSGNATIVFERIGANAPYTVTPIFTGPAGGEVFGAVWDPAISAFLVHNISSVMATWSTTGVRSNVQPATIEDVRGMVLLATGGGGPQQAPTMSEWMMALMAVLMLFAAMRVRRR